jgi:UDP:flavonoid glycosyltransferase YjiC (YdhE family)
VAGLLAACPTTVIPFFGDQAFWGSAAFRRGVGPKPIPIDNLSTKKLVEALHYMQKPEVKLEAQKVSELIKQVTLLPHTHTAAQMYKHLNLSKDLECLLPSENFIPTKKFGFIQR